MDPDTPAAVLVEMKSLQEGPAPGYRTPGSGINEFEVLAGLQMTETQGASKEGFWGRGQRLGSYLQRVEAGIWQRR